MKKVIRYGVFETNSSSTHSMTYSKVAPEEYTFECASPWSRLVVLRALTIVALESERRKEETFEVQLDYDEELEKEYKEMMGAITEEETSDETSIDEDEFVCTPDTSADILVEFYDACAALYCERAGVSKEDLVEHLGKLSATDIMELKNVDRYVNHFKRCYYGNDCDLCECLFEEGPLDFCTCGYETAFSILFDIFGGSDYLTCKDFGAKAEEYLYGEKRFFATEHYAGCKTYDCKKKV